MSNFIDIPGSQEDFWWSYDPTDTPASSSKDNFTENVDNTKLHYSKSTLIGTSESDNTGNSKPTRSTEEVIQTGELKVEETKYNKSNLKRPSGAQRRKRKWLRFELHKETTDLHDVQDGLKRLNINEFKQVIPSYSKKEAEFDNINHTIVNSYKVPHRFKKHLDNEKTFKVKNSNLNSLPGSQQINDQTSNSLNDKNPNYCKRKLEGYSDQSNQNKRTNYSAALNNELNAVIFDESNVEGILSFEQSNLIIDTLMTKLSDCSTIADFEVPKFQGYYLNRGVLTVNCVNDNSLNWLMNIELKDLWDGAKLKILKANEFVKHIRLTAFFPGPVRENVEILKLLKTQNPELNTSRWRIYHRSQGASTSVSLILGVDEKSLQVLSSLEMNPYYGMSRATFHLPDNRRTTRNSSPCK